mmetsp:Transcript_16839/g.40656  ORF Transcript_16839/g.40656 Transcript_16839/m.40656 type:complete len:252 (-) Transcript_16839:376-1131(-)
MDPNFSLDESDIPTAEEADPKDVKIFRELVGSLGWVVTWTRSDCAFSVNYLARFLLRPNRRLINTAKQVILYLASSRDSGIHFRRRKPSDPLDDMLQVYADTSDADCKLTSRSTGGFIVFINGAAVSWKSGRLPLVTLSSAESEYVQITMACQEILFLRELMEKLGYGQKATVVFEDNQAAIALCNNPVFHRRTRHIRRRYHFVRQCVEDGEIYIAYVKSEDNVADMLTKPLPYVVFIRHRRKALNEDARI